MKSDVFLAVPISGKMADLKYPETLARKLFLNLVELRVFRVFYLSETGFPPKMAYRLHQDEAKKATAILSLMSLNPEYLTSQQPDILPLPNQPIILVANNFERPGVLEKLDDIPTPNKWLCALSSEKALTDFSWKNPLKEIIFLEKFDIAQQVIKIASLTRVITNGA